MAAGDQTRRWAAVVLVGLVGAGLGAFLAVQDLDRANKWSGVFGLFLTLAGVGLSAYGLFGARRAAGGQSVDDSVVGGGVTQVRGVRGDVRIGGSAPATGSPSAPTAPPPSAAGMGAGGVPAGDGQSVTRSWAAGPVRQVDGVGGDVDIDR
ncbi:hypothetical protein O7602_08735 [Micromonospora sp. WMMD1128]|uniref:hypothetical protein n=1 Tax=Micromonospora sp. WMMD1128 TaxID=3015150 RepID=UPI00248BB5F8|nr:hypothetical protein [Micromonospora sp. WMMD1128]WBB75576.1 hypothetical protein O7602_08735 [Micromonospora sp. WMMD1128]